MSDEVCGPDACGMPGYCDGRHCVEAGGAIRPDWTSAPSGEEVRIAELKAENARLAAFAKEVLRAGWEGSAVDGGTLQELGVKHGLLRETKYDPAQHGPNDCDAEPGDPWFVFAGRLAPHSPDA